jgi:6-phosphogluconate dehydrogenase
MVHNGVEYGMIQAYAQGLSALSDKKDFDFDLETVTGVWRHGVMARSALLDLIHKALDANPDLGALAPYVADEGENRWTVDDALDQIAQRGFDRDQFL